MQGRETVERTLAVAAALIVAFLLPVLPGMLPAQTGGGASSTVPRRLATATTSMAVSPPPITSTRPVR